MKDEYGRRNLLHCKAVGAHANAVAARDRLLAMKAPPKWLLDALFGIIDRTREVMWEMADHRDEASPYIAPPADAKETKR